jgi:hypothetical protein
MIRFEPTGVVDALAVVVGAVPSALDRERLAGLPVVALAITRDGAQVGAMVLGIVTDGWGHDLIVYAAEGKGGGLTEAMDAYLHHLAGVLGLDGVRCHTRRAGLVRKLTGLGWGEATRMMRVAVR